MGRLQLVDRMPGASEEERLLAAVFMEGPIDVRVIERTHRWVTSVCPDDIDTWTWWQRFVCWLFYPLDVFATWRRRNKIVWRKY